MNLKFTAEDVALAQDFVNQSKFDTSKAPVSTDGFEVVDDTLNVGGLFITKTLDEKTKAIVFESTTGTPDGEVIELGKDKSLFSALKTCYLAQESWKIDRIIESMSFSAAMKEDAEIAKKLKKEKKSPGLGF